MKQIKSQRYHCYNSNGTKIIKQFPISTIPTQLPGCTEWRIGMGPLSPEARTNISDANKKMFSGVPKSDEQRAKMRAAKLGVPKTEAHREAMRIAQQRRWYG